MKTVLGALVGATMVLAAGAAAAADAKGVIDAMNIETRVLKIGGVDYTVPQNVSLSGYIVGTNVSITYTTANNVNTVSAIAKVAK